MKCNRSKLRMPQLSIKPRQILDGAGKPQIPASYEEKQRAERVKQALDEMYERQQRAGVDAPTWILNKAREIMDLIEKSSDEGFRCDNLVAVLGALGSISRRFRGASHADQREERKALVRKARTMFQACPAKRT